MNDNESAIENYEFYLLCFVEQDKMECNVYEKLIFNVLWNKLND